MLIIYDSKTGNVKRFINKLNMECIQIKEDLIINIPFILITYTTGIGQLPETISKFLIHNSHNLIGVAASGNRNWGNSFAIVADIISEKYNVPILHKFELAGTKKDVEKFKQEVRKLVKCSNMD